MAADERRCYSETSEEERPDSYALQRNSSETTSTEQQHHLVTAETLPTFEDILRVLNPAGLWQWSILVQCCVTMSLVSMLNYEQNYLLAGKMDYCCVDEAKANNFTCFQDTLNDDERHDHCKRVDGVTPCLNWNYSSPYYESTMISEFNLICDYALLVPIYKSLSLVGFFFGLAVWGAVGDVYGRWPIIAALIPLKIGTFWLQTYAGDYWVMLVVRVVNGVLGGGYYKAIFILNQEVTTESRRNFVAVCFASCFPIGGLLTSLVGYCIGEWRVILFWSVSVATITIPLCFMLPESPRWLITNEKYARANAVLKRGARINRRKLPIDLDLKALHDAHVGERTSLARRKMTWRTFVALISDSEIRIRTLVMFSQWFSVAVTFYGVTWYATTELRGSPFTKLALSCAARLLCAPLVAFSMQKAGKRGMMLAIWLFGGISVAGLAALPKEAPIWLTTALSVIASVIFDAGYTLVYTFTGELYPTLLRQSGMSLCSMASRIGAAMAPFIVDVLSPLWHQLPAIVMLAACVFAALFLAAVPETNLRALPDTLADAHRLRQVERDAAVEEGATTVEMVNLIDDNRRQAVDDACGKES